MADFFAHGHWTDWHPTNTTEMSAAERTRRNMFATLLYDERRPLGIDTVDLAGPVLAFFRHKPADSRIGQE